MELLQSAQEALAALKDVWPGLPEEAALGIGDGGQQATWCICSACMTHRVPTKGPWGCHWLK